MYPKIFSSTTNTDIDIQFKANPDGGWVLSEEVSLFTAEFSRDDDDLILQSANGQDARLVDYFVTETPADLVSFDGATLRGAAVERLAGPLFPGQYAQLGGQDLANAIGQVESLSGAAFVQRTDGQIVQLEIGAKVFQGDVVRTESGGTLGLTFTDGTIFTLASGSRMVLDELIYDPQATDNSGVFDLVEGSFVFIAGQTAKTGGIEISTPAATMGIRGTTGKIDIQTVNGVTSVTVSLNPDPDGGLGAIELFDLTGELITTITGTETKWIISPPFTNEPPIEISRNPSDLGDDAVLLSQALAAFQSAVTRVQQGETFVELPDGEGEVQDDTNELEEAPDEGTGDAEPIRPAPLDETGDGTGEDGESGAGNPELDGTDEPIIDEDPGTGTEDDAALEPAPTDQGTTETASNGNERVLFTDLAVQSTEDTSLTSQLPINNRSGETVEVSLTRGAENGLVVLASDGTFTYTPEPNFDGTDSFEISGTDEEGVIQAAVVTVVVDPVNDAPVVSFQTSTAASIEEGASTAPGSGAVSGTLTYVDVDEGTVPGNWSIQAAQSNATSFGTISIDPTTGIWRYNLNQELTDTLTDGDVFDETFIATVTDDGGATDVSTVIVRVTGTNDSPVIAATVEQTSASLVTGPGAADFDDPSAVATGSVSGTLTYTDVDEGATTATWSIAADGGNATAFGQISITAAGIWTYAIDETAPVPLGNGQTATEVFTATVTDALGATAAQAITITITGTNEAPTIIFSIEDVSATVIEDGFGTVVAGSSPSTVEADDSGFRFRRSESNEQTFERTSASTDGEPSATGTLRYVDSQGNSGSAAWSIAPETASLGMMIIDEITGEWNYFLDQELANSMREGDQQIETFLATVTDPFGATASQVITITVLGTNDAATIETSAQDLVGAVAEDGVTTASGQLNFVDPDAAPGETANWTIASDENSRGSMTIDAETGEWLYTLDPLLADNLPEGDPVTEIHVATVTDSLGATAEQIITITLTGQNDAPTLVSGTATLAKDTASVTLNLAELGSDADLGENGGTLSYSISGSPSEGSAQIDGLTLTFNTDSAFSDLGEGESRDVDVEVTATDSFGATTFNTMVFTVTGSNTGPVITSDAAAAQGAAVEAGESTPGTAVVSGTLTYTDADAATPTSGTWTVAPITAVFGSIVIDPTTGAWSYTLDDVAADALNAGDAETDTFLATITDEDGQEATQEITIGITGTNDAPILDAGTGSLDDNDASVTIALAGLASDPDAEDDAASLIFAIVSGPTSVGTAFADNGSAALAGNDLTFSTDGDFDALGDGESRSVVVQIGVTDAQGVQTINDVTITVNGTETAPVIVSSPGDAIGNTVEAGFGTPGTALVRGTLTYTDADAITPTSGTWTVAPTSAAYGSMVINATTGGWTYTLDNSAADALNEGQAEVDTFLATITDEDGLTDTQVIEIDITGTNDAPLVAVGSGNMSEDDASLAIDLEALVSDADAEDDATSLIFAIVSGPTSVGTVFADNGSTALVGRDLVFSTDGDFDALGDGESRAVVVQIGATDAQGVQTINDVTITVNGRETGPLITSSAADAEGSVIEMGDGVAGTATTTGTLTYLDEDGVTPTSGAWSVSADTVPTLGTMSINLISGVWTYILNDTLAELLDEGDTRIERFTATITDVDGLFDTQEIVVTVNGSNDAPTLRASFLTVAEEGGDVTLDLATLAGDLDDDDTIASLTFSLAVASPNASVFGSTFTFNPSSDFQNLAAGASAEIIHDVVVEDLQGATATSQVTVTITGVNDDPTLVAGTLAATEDGGLVTLDLSTLAADADDGAVLTYALVAPPANATLLGSVLTFDTGTDFQGLALGEEQDVTVSVLVEDGLGGSVTNDVTVTVTGTNDAPTLLTNLGTLVVSETDATSEILSSTFFTTGGRADDVDSDDTASSLTYLFSNPSTGNLVPSTVGYALAIAGNYNFLAAGQTATETLDVTARDTNGALSSVGTITWEIQGVNSTPTMGNGSASVTEDSGVTSISLTSLGQDDDASEDGTTLTYNITGGPATGLAVINPGALEFDTNGAFEYLGDGDSEVVTVNITATDAASAVSNVGTVSITVTGVNDAPVITNSTTNPGEDSGVTLIPVAATDADTGDAANLTYEIVTGPAKGIATVGVGGINFDTNGEFETLGAGASELVTIDVRATDGDGAVSNTATLTLVVAGANDAPTVTDAGVTITEDTIVNSFDISTQGQDVDDGAVLTYQVTDAPDKGLFSFLGTNLTFRTNGEFDNLAAGDTELVTLEFTARDETNAQSSPGTFTYTITGVNDAPTMADAAVGIDANDGLTQINLNGVDVDDGQDASNLIYSIVTGPGAGNGTAVINGSNIDFNTNNDFNDVAAGATEEITIEVRAEDFEGAFSNTSTLTITVTGENNAPVAIDGIGSAQLVSRAGASEFGENNHYYDFVRGYFDWGEARTTAALQGGYLATITSANENAFAANLVATGNSDVDAWLGGSDAPADFSGEGDWHWVTGPEDGDQFWTGDSTGSPFGGAFENWFAGQPNAADAASQDYLAMQRFGGGVWDDVQFADGRGYLVEFDEVALITGSVGAFDADAGDTLTFALSAAVDGLTMATDGSWTFDPTSDAYTSRAEGEAFDVIANFTVTDPTLETDTGTLTLSLTGANDAPTVVDDSVQITTSAPDAGPIGSGWTLWDSASGGNDHSYQYIVPRLTWSAAQADAVARGGHLATITSAAENAFVNSLATVQVGWIGGTDAAVEGDWRWVGGPEDGQTFSVEDGLGDVLPSASYSNWDSVAFFSGSSGTNDRVLMMQNGEWRDFAQNSITTFEYYVEYSPTDIAGGSVATNDSDPEGDAITYELNGTYDGLTMAANGSWTFDRAHATYASLDDGDSVFISAYYDATDVHGASSDGRLQIQVIGTNDAPVVVGETENISLAVDSGPTGGGWVQWGGAIGGNDNYYQYVAGSIDFAGARAGALALGGHLATITSAGEQDHIDLLRPDGAQSVGWLAGSDEAVEGEWRWVEGPEAGQQFWQGGIAGSPVNSSYTNWDPDNGGQPNAGGEDAIHTFGTGVWNNLTPTDNLAGYYAEYSGVLPVTGSVATNDSDPEGDTLTYTLVAPVADLDMDTAGNWTFDRTDSAYDALAQGETDVVNVGYNVSDGTNTSGGVLQLNLTGVNNAPVTTLVNAGSVAEDAGAIVIDLLANASDVDNGASLATQEFSFQWTGDNTTSPTVSMVGSTVTVDPSIMAELDTGESATLNLSYEVSDGITEVFGNATLEITGVANSTTIEAVIDVLSPGGTATNEDFQFSIPVADLLLNDLDPGGLGLSVIDVSPYSERGATVLLVGSNISYIPTTSAVLNDLAAGATLDDVFKYTIQSGDGLQTSTNEVAFDVLGLAPSADNTGPVVQSTTTNGFSGGDRDVYEINYSWLIDDSVPSTGLTYKFSQSSVDQALPDFLSYDTFTKELSVDSAIFDSGTDSGVYNLVATGFEADGDYTSIPFTAVFDSNGDFVFTLFGGGGLFDQVLEIGIDEFNPLGGTGTVNLSGIDAIVLGGLEDVAVIDLTNGQANTMEIDSDALLGLIDEAAASGNNESIVIKADATDIVSFATSADWNAVTTSTTTAELTGVSGAFAGLGLFATIDLEGTSYPSS